MQFRRSTFLLIGISLLSVALAVAAIVRYRSQLAREQAPQMTEKSVNQFINKFRTSHSQLFILEIFNNWDDELPEELTQPENLLPSPDRYQAERLYEVLKAGSECQTIKPGADKNLQKLRRWFDFKCGRTSTLDPSVWRSPPLIHPLGGSWTHWLFKNGFGNTDWLVGEKAYLHLLEFRTLPPEKLSALESVLADFTPLDLRRYLSGAGFLASSSYVLITSYAGPNESVFLVFSRSDWDRYLKKSGVVVSSGVTEACDFKEFSYCWGVALEERKNIDPQVFLFGMLLLVAGLAATLLFTLWKRAQDDEKLLEKQQLVMQTLAHELRLPVTGFKLSLESIRPHYDRLPDDVMSDFLRLASISERMTRLVNFSQQYLQLLSRDREFVFHENNVESFQSFLENILDEYCEKIQIHASPGDTACSIDAYWASTCITNLVKNALAHGQSPVTVSWVREGRDLKVIIQDAGPGPSLSLSALTKPVVKPSEAGGMGIGLSLVFRLARLMNGSLELQKNPTRFTLTLRGVCHD